MEARKTEYNGKVFRSKTEAMFAIILDSKKNQYTRWEYEPNRFVTTDKYIPDFIEHYGCEAFLSDFISLIEVKPARPTLEYLNYLERQFKWIKDNDKYHFITWYMLVVFNPYQRIFEYITTDEDGKFSVLDFDTPDWFNPDWFDTVLKYRFDLEQ